MSNSAYGRSDGCCCKCPLGTYPLNSWENYSEWLWESKAHLFALMELTNQYLGPQATMYFAFWPARATRWGHAVGRRLRSIRRVVRVLGQWIPRCPVIVC